MAAANYEWSCTNLSLERLGIYAFEYHGKKLQGHARIKGPVGL
jgi:hypothetical protein